MLSLSALELEALTLSLRVSLWASLVTLPVAVLVAWILARYQFPGKTLLNGLIHLPLVLPPVVIGYALLVLLGRQGVLGQMLYEAFGITIIFTWRGAAVAAAVMTFPLMVRAIRLSLESCDRGLEETARTLGAGPFRCFLTITLPLMAPGLLTGTFLAFARSLGEFGATISFVSNIPGETQTLPLALYSAIQTPGGEAAALRLTVLSIALAMLALLLSEVMARRLHRRLKG